MPGIGCAFTEDPSLVDVDLSVPQIANAGLSIIQVNINFSTFLPSKQPSPMLKKLAERARPLRKRIVLPEGQDPRTIHAALALHEQSLVRPILLGNEEVIRATAAAERLSLPSGLTIVDPARSVKAGDLARELFNLRKHRGLTFEQAREQVHDVLYHGALLVRRGDADGCVAGAAHATADVLRAAIQVVGVAPSSTLVSSFFLMVLPDGRAVTFADCAVVPDPDIEQLASIGIDAARSHRLLTGEEPRVAFLSFSTHGSAQHPRVDKVREAARRAASQHPELAIDGDLQFDAAFDPDVGKSKAPDSKVAGQANVFVFPDLDAANIGYKIAQRVGGAEALGPILQGLSKPCNDLSRGATAEDIMNVAVITAILAAEPSPGHE